MVKASPGVECLGFKPRFENLNIWSSIEMLISFGAKMVSKMSKKFNSHLNTGSKMPQTAILGLVFRSWPWSWFWTENSLVCKKNFWHLVLRSALNSCIWSQTLIQYLTCHIFSSLTVYWPNLAVKQTGISIWIPGMKEP